MQRENSHSNEGFERRMIHHRKAVGAKMEREKAEVNSESIRAVVLCQ